MQNDFSGNVFLRTGVDGVGECGITKRRENDNDLFSGRNAQQEFSLAVGACAKRVVPQSDIDHVERLPVLIADNTPKRGVVALRKTGQRNNKQNHENIQLFYHRHKTNKQLLYQLFRLK